MGEYIEREALIKRLEHEADCSTSLTDVLVINGLANLVRDERIAPTVDVVEVVRCKDCQFFKRDTDYCKKRNKGYCYWDNTIKTRTHFCGYGKRKEGAEKCF